MMSARIKWSHITHKISSISQLVKFSKNTKRKETKSWNTSLRMTTNTLWSTKVLKTRIIHSWFSILTTSKRSQLIRVMEPQKLKFQDQRKTRSILKMRLPLSKTKCHHKDCKPLKTIPPFSRNQKLAFRTLKPNFR